MANASFYRLKFRTIHLVIDYHFPLPFMDQMFERLAGKSFYCFLDGYSGYNQLLLILRIKKRLHLHVHLVHMHIEECSLLSLMHLQLFKDA